MPRPRGAAAKEPTGLLRAVANCAEATKAAVLPVKYLEIPEPGPEGAVKRVTPSLSLILMFAMQSPVIQ